MAFFLSIGLVSVRFRASAKDRKIRTFKTECIDIKSGSTIWHSPSLLC